MRPKKKMEKRDTLRPNLITIDGCGAGAAEIIQEDIVREELDVESG